MVAQNRVNPALWPQGQQFGLDRRQVAAAKGVLIEGIPGHHNHVRAGLIDGGYDFMELLLIHIGPGVDVAEQGELEILSRARKGDRVLFYRKTSGVSEAVDGHRGRQKQGNEIEPAVLQSKQQGGRVIQQKAERHIGEKTEQDPTQVKQLPGFLFFFPAVEIRQHIGEERRHGREDHNAEVKTGKRLRKRAQPG